MKKWERPFDLPLHNIRTTKMILKNLVQLITIIQRNYHVGTQM